ncbi:MAG: ATP-grasp domain-containing protein [Frisingicoccus sp.]|uniref:ATP-grasp domain-containing protein n=1 Tax=Frisingicoccus sp. TaxID=1918627 RepID=UPI0026354474|nr:ATP-grasp domain-containing protein [Frisingicoccus sp.]MDD6233065.1 ATP-grasp domain-containing protein [Frisingicoccus sp.]MDY4833719.1 ATP-grasp domain-containing protein [Frisingicoccus sp.]
MKGKRLLIIAGGTWQVPLIKKAKELGFEVVNSNLYEDSIGFQYADFGEVSDVKDKDKNLEIAKRYQVDGVITDQSDIAVPTVAYVATKLGLPTIGEDKAALFTDKFQMREFCKDHGFPYPEYKLCSTADEVKAFLERTGKTIIIKPIDSQSSRGVHVIEHNDRIEELFEDARQYSKDGKSVIAERFIQGTEFTIDGIVTEKGHVSLAISEKKHFEYNESIASELFFSNVNSRFDYDLLRRTNNALIDSAELPFGITHAEYKFEDGQFYLIEMAARGGGTKIASDIVPIMSGVDNYACLLDFVSGKVQAAEIKVDEALVNRCAVLKFIDVNSKGRPVKGISGVEDIRNNDHVIDFGLEFGVGDIVGEAEDDRSRVGYYIAYEESEEKLRSLMKVIEETLKVDF